MKGRSGMSRGLLALFISLAVHALAAVAIVAYFECGPEPDVLATLDLSSVELSFAEREDETAAVAPSRPSAAQEAPPPKPRTPEPPPSPDKVASAQPPDPSAMKFAEPKEERPEMKTPERPVAVPAAMSARASKFGEIIRVLPSVRIRIAFGGCGRRCFRRIECAGSYSAGGERCACVDKRVRHVVRL